MTRRGRLGTTVPLSDEALLDSAGASITRGFTQEECITSRIDPCPTTVEEILAGF